MKNLSIASKQFIILIIVVIGFIAINLFSLSYVKKSMTDARGEELKHLGQTSLGVMSHFYKMSDKGLISAEEAQKNTFDVLRDIRYGNNDYYFIFDWTGVNHMLGPSPEKEGKNLSEAKDTDGKFYIKDLITTAENGGGLVHYNYPKPGATEPSPKLSYSATFTPWKMLIGTGVYMDDLNNEFNTFARNLITVAIAGLILIGGVILKISRDISRPLTLITKQMNLLADGDKTIDVPFTDRKDEVGKLAHALLTFKENAIKVDHMQEQQKELEVKAELQRKQALLEMADKFEQSVQGVVAAVSTAATEVKNNAQTLATTAKETTNQSNTVSQAAQRASESVQTTATASEEINASISEIARQSQESVRVTDACMDEAQTTSNAMHELNKAAEDIESVVNLIDGIAHQVDLLALNATIEAARAGESGKGFAVVAGEVKTLANQTGAATKDIAQKVSNMQARAKSSVESIARITDIIHRVKEIATSVASATEEQGAATAEISRSVQKTAGDTDEVSRNILSVNKAAQKTGDASNQMLETADQLSKESEMLRNTVNNFINHIRSA